ncbi:flavodoxin family protein [Vallitalea okinawensis]|uniref:flavodoxin family protein n=1 Tax=Vallitalea okinawensis TaxID=2078660 RepID=UPI000CFDE523|nr:flavodoxin family protein [Vallitalea okinawensis]
MIKKNTLIICASVHRGNTIKIAEVIGEVLNAKIIEPKNLDIESFSNYDLVGFGSGIYNRKHHKSLFNFVSNLNDQNNKKAFVFSTSTIPLETTHKSLKVSLIDKNFQIIGDFYCKGFMNHSFAKYIFGGLNKGRPNDKDIINAQDFARKINTILN